MPALFSSAGRAAATVSPSRRCPMQRWRIGDVTVTKIVELEAVGGSRFILPDATREAVRPIGWLRPHFADDEGRLKMSVHALVVETPSRRVIVDTCIGNGKQQRAIPAWNGLRHRLPRRSRAGGISARRHRHRALHPSPCRPRRLEHDAGRRPLGPDISPRALPDGAHRVRALAGAARPCRPRPRFRGFRGAGVRGRARRPRRHRSSDLATSSAWCRHSATRPAMSACASSSRGEEALITGDFLHHPCQMARPDWTSPADHDPSSPGARGATCSGAWPAATVLVIGTHFAGATAGHVVAEGGAWRLAVD